MNRHTSEQPQEGSNFIPDAVNDEPGEDAVCHRQMLARAGVPHLSDSEHELQWLSCSESLGPTPAGDSATGPSFSRAGADVLPA